MVKNIIITSTNQQNNTLTRKTIKNIVFVGFSQNLKILVVTPEGEKINGATVIISELYLVTDETGQVTAQREIKKGEMIQVSAPGKQTVKTKYIDNTLKTIVITLQDQVKYYITPTQVFKNLVPHEQSNNILG